MSILIYPDLSYRINGILYKVHNELGRFLNEKQYCDLIEEFLKNQKISFEREKILPQAFPSEKIGRSKVDFLIENKIILEIKTKIVVTSEDYFQLKRYLRSLNIKLGIIVNFRRRFLSPKRILNSLAKEDY